MLMKFQNFFIKNRFKKNQIFDFSKKWVSSKLKIKKRSFLIIAPNNINYHEQFKNFPKTK